MPAYFSVGTPVPRRGAEVAQITEKSLKDVLEVRRALDALCAELACDRISAEEMEQLKDACDGFEKATKTKDATAIAKADVTLHDIIVAATGNRRLGFNSPVRIAFRNVLNTTSLNGKNSSIFTCNWSFAIKRLGLQKIFL